MFSNPKRFDRQRVLAGFAAGVTAILTTKVVGVEVTIEIWMVLRR
jgi:hypothetical protein